MFSVLFLVISISSQPQLSHFRKQPTTLCVVGRVSVTPGCPSGGPGRLAVFFFSSSPLSFLFCLKRCFEDGVCALSTLFRRLFNCFMISSLFSMIFSSVAILLPHLACSSLRLLYSVFSVLYLFFHLKFSSFRLVSLSFSLAMASS